MKQLFIRGLTEQENGTLEIILTNKLQ
jgi:hypothetical protein